jgi:uncharacterized protein YndB with AHSA1/START domain
VTRIHLERAVPASPDRVFALHTDPVDLARWFGPHGFTARTAELDPRVGGRYRIEMHPPEGALFHIAGEFRAVDPPARLEYTFVYEEPDPDDRETVVTFTVAATTDAADATLVTVDQGDFATEARRALHEQGWTDTLDRLHEVIVEDN